MKTAKLDKNLHKLSTSEFDVTQTICMIEKDESIIERYPPRLEHTIALPYYIPCKGYKDSKKLYEKLRELENKCLKELRERVLLRRMEGKRMKCIFLELMMAGCGAVLSKEFLSRLAVLLKSLGMFAIVDEILTGGRTG